jgi:hypothetical protein
VNEEGEVTARILQRSALTALWVACVAAGCWAVPIDFEPSTYNPMIGQSVRFGVCEACLEDASYTFEWDLDGDGRYETTTQDPVVFATYDTAGYVEVNLRAGGSGGHRSLASRALLVGETPFVAQRALEIDREGALLVTVTVTFREGGIGVAIIEEIPAGWQLEIVDPGQMSAHKYNGKLHMLWMSEVLLGECYTFSYRLHRGSAWDSPMLEGTISGYAKSNTNQYIVIPLCGEIWEPEL